MKFPLSFLLLVSIIVISGQAQSFENQLEQEIAVAMPQLEQPEPPQLLSQEPQKTYHINNQELSANPALIEIFINQAIDQHRAELLPELLAMYQVYSQADPILIQYAQGIYAQSQGNYQQAITNYRQLLADYPDLIKVRFKLAQFLFEDKQFTAAKDQFRKLNAEYLPKEIHFRIGQYLHTIEKQNELKIRFGLSYLNDNNINNASSVKYIYLDQYQFVKDPRYLPQKGQGVSYNLNVSKLFNLIDHHYLYLENHTYGKYYWNNKDYSETENRTYLGYQYQNAHYRFALLPLYQKHWYANKQYSQGYGIRLEGDKWLSNQWQLVTALELSKTSYKRSERIKYSQLYSGSLLYIANAKRLLYGGADILVERSNINLEQSNKYMLRLGWQQEWKYGLSSNLHIQLGLRKFKDKDNLKQIIRQDKEMRINLTLWKRDWHWFNFTPKLQYRYQRINSNIPEFYSYDKSQFQLLLEKTF
ncbi:surface lipoprotein assembly modifier [Volucribacter amazonae]|uniref:Tetratricopeptide repeat protein n=1 Tax=Volucribacter amazonae TaxID=256731 RepID=A0A9X4PFI9_9PAST|nr:surface lipoprotein assembly modifier [Volucribacter amazonae]MDG6896329.1 hypothetical protein [Volucribacter amazonae]